MAGTSTVALFNEKLQADSLFLDDVICRHVMDVFFKYSLLFLVRAEDSQEVRVAFRGSWIGVFGHPMSIQMDEGGGWKNELRAELRKERLINV